MIGTDTGNDVLKTGFDEEAADAEFNGVKIQVLLVTWYGEADTMPLSLSLSLYMKIYIQIICPYHFVRMEPLTNLGFIL